MGIKNIIKGTNNQCRYAKYRSKNDQTTNVQLNTKEKAGKLIKILKPLIIDR